MSNDDHDDGYINEEWDRVTDNPQNMIVSDSIRDLLEPNQFGLGENDLNSQIITLTLNFSDDIKIQADLLFFEKSTERIKFSFVCDKSDAAKVFLGKKIKSVKVYSETYGINYCVEVLPEDEEPLLSFEFSHHQIEDNTLNKGTSSGNLIIRL